MDRINWGYLFGMALQTVPEPRKVARDVFAFAAPRRALWQILALLLVVLTFLAVIQSVLFPVDAEDLDAIFGEGAVDPGLTNPLLSGGIWAFLSFGAVWLIYGIGKAAGGTGTLDEAILTVIWLVFVLVLLQGAILVLGLFAPGLALLLTAMSFVMAFWLLSHFIAEMHGFRSAGAVFAGILMAMMVMMVVLSILLSILGIGMVVDAGPGGA